MNNRINHIDTIKKFAIGFFIVWVCCNIGIVFAEDAPKEKDNEKKINYQAVTASNPNIPKEELRLLLLPLTDKELEVEANAWMKVLQNKIYQTSQVELAIQRKRREESQHGLSKAEETQTPSFQLISPAQAEETKPVETAPAVAPVETNTPVPPETKPAETAPAIAPVEANTPVPQETKPVETAPAAQPVEAPTPAPQETKPVETAPAVQPVEAPTPAPAPQETKPVETAPAAQPVETPAKTQQTVAKDELALKNETVENLLIKQNALKQEQTALLERFQLVIDQLAAKGGNVDSYNKYVAAISGLNINVSDSQALRIAVTNWITSKDGGLLWLINMLIFISCVAIAWFISHWLIKLITPYLSAISGLSGLMRAFLLKVIHRGIIIIGILIGLTALGVSLAPLLALLGGVSFILAFALQGNLNNFASGLMILFYKPFDVGDEIKLTAGDTHLWGKVDSITLANTKLNGFSQELITIPNAFVWENVITNLTHEKRRQINIPIHVGHNEDLSKLKPLLMDAMSAHSKILKTPNPSVAVWKIESDYVEVVVKGWTEAEDFWGIYEEVLCLIQPKLQNAAIEFSSPSFFEKD